MELLNNLEMDTLEDVYFYILKTSNSPLLYQYNEKTDLWTILHESLKDEQLIKLMVFNLEFNITPLHVFIKYYQKKLEEMHINRFDKQCIGSHVAFILAAFGYKKTRQIYRKDAIIKYAAYFELDTEDCTEEDNGSNNGNSGNIFEA